LNRRSVVKKTWVDNFGLSFLQAMTILLQAMAKLVKLAKTLVQVWQVSFLENACLGAHTSTANAIY
jgi:hypothetical protein